MKTARPQLLDQRQQRHALANTGAMQPGERPGRSGLAGMPQPFAQAPGIFLAASSPPFKQHGPEGREQNRRAAIGRQKCAAARHPGLAPDNMRGLAQAAPMARRAINARGPGRIEEV